MKPVLNLSGKQHRTIANKIVNLIEELNHYDATDDDLAAIVELTRGKAGPVMTRHLGAALKDII
jgi:hypothetical protein